MNGVRWDTTGIGETSNGEAGVPNGGDFQRVAGGWGATRRLPAGKHCSGQRVAGGQLPARRLPAAGDVPSGRG
jgi:hypothetical protein